MSYLASVLRLGLSPEASFSQWAWQLLLRLKLHGNTQYPQAAWSIPGSAPNPSPELTHAPNMHPVLRAVKAGLPIGCYLAIAMTTIGHRYHLLSLSHQNPFIRQVHFHIHGIRLNEQVLTAIDKCTNRIQTEKFTQSRHTEYTI